MNRASLVTAAAGLVGSLLVSVAGYVLFDTLLVFLVVPLVPILARGAVDRPPEKRCRSCGFRTRSADVDYCPRDGTELDAAPSAER